MRLYVPAVIVGSAFGMVLLRLITGAIDPLTTSALWAIPPVAPAFAALVVGATVRSSRKAAGIDPALTMNAE